MITRQWKRGWQTKRGGENIQLAAGAHSKAKKLEAGQSNQCCKTWSVLQCPCLYPCPTPCLCPTMPVLQCSYLALCQCQRINQSITISLFQLLSQTITPGEKRNYNARRSKMWEAKNEDLQIRSIAWFAFQIETILQSIASEPALNEHLRNSPIQ